MPQKISSYFWKTLYSELISSSLRSGSVFSSISCEMLIISCLVCWFHAAGRPGSYANTFAINGVEERFGLHCGVISCRIFCSSSMFCSLSG